MSLKSRFKKWVDDYYNPVTPEIHNLEQVNDKIIEIAASRNKEMYGVSVWHETDNTQVQFEALNHDINRPFHDKEEAIAYAQLLKQKLKDHAEIEDIIQEGIK